MLWKTCPVKNGNQIHLDIHVIWDHGAAEFETEFKEFDLLEVLNLFCFKLLHIISMHQHILTK